MKTLHEQFLESEWALNCTDTAHVRRRYEEFVRTKKADGQSATMTNEEWENKIPCSPCHLTCHGPCKKYDDWLLQNPEKAARGQSGCNEPGYIALAEKWQKAYVYHKRMALAEEKSHYHDGIANTLKQCAEELLKQTKAI